MRKVMWLIGFVIVSFATTLFVAHRADARIQRIERTINLPSLPSDVNIVLNVDNDPVRGVCVGYLTKDDVPRLIQYGYSDTISKIEYNQIHRFCFRENRRGWRAPRGFHVVPSLPNDCVEVISITNDPKVGITVGFVNKKQEVELIQYYVQRQHGELVFPEDMIFRFKFAYK